MYCYERKMLFKPREVIQCILMYYLLSLLEVISLRSNLFYYNSKQYKPQIKLFVVLNFRQSIFSSLFKVFIPVISRSTIFYYSQFACIATIVNILFIPWTFKSFLYLKFELLTDGTFEDYNLMFKLFDCYQGLGSFHGSLK